MKTSKFFWVRAIFLGWSGDSKQKILYGRPQRVLMSFLAHLSRRLIWWAYRIGRPPSYFVRSPHSLNIFSSETTGPIKVKFHMELLWDGGTKVCSNVPGHMTEMATMPIYGKNLKKSSSLEPKGWWPWSWYEHCVHEYYQVCSWPILRQVQIWTLTTAWRSS